MKLRFTLVVTLFITIGILTACGSGETPASPQPALPAATPGAPSSALPTTPPPTAVPPADVPTPSAEATTSTPPTTEPPMSAPEPPTPTTEPTPTLTLLPVDLSTIALDVEQVADGLKSPVFVTHAGDGSGRLFVVEKPGKILAFDANGQSVGAFLDIRDRVGSSGSEQGLLGLAFHPQFATTGRLFVYYTDKDGDTVVSRFQANADHSEADPASELVVLTAEQPAANHNGGMLAFGPDGRLYIGLGDGGGANDRYGNGQKLDTLLGKILRIDVDSGESAIAPADNPFAGQEGVRPETWAYGLRNPWRFSFDRQTGDLWIADVGQGDWEEVNFQPAASLGGENYGWPIMEGTHCFDAKTCDQAGLTLPVAEYAHGEDCSVSGGYVYRGSAQPRLHGIYFYGDYCSGIMRGLAQDASGQWQSAELLDTDLQISSFGETENGDVLVVDLNGSVYRLVQK